MSEIVNVYIAYGLDAWPRNSTNNLKFEICLFGATNIVKNSDKYEIKFDTAGSCSFDNKFARNVISFSVDNSLSSHADNCKNNFLVLMKVQLMVLMEALDHQRKSFVLILLKETQNFVWVCIIMLTIVICFLMETKSLKMVKNGYKNVNFLNQFGLKSISNGFSAT